MFLLTIFHWFTGKIYCPTCKKYMKSKTTTVRQTCEKNSTPHNCIFVRVCTRCENQLRFLGTLDHPQKEETINSIINEVLQQYDIPITTPQNQIPPLVQREIDERLKRYNLRQTLEMIQEHHQYEMFGPWD